MKRTKKLETRDVIETIEVDAPPDRLLAVVLGRVLASWQHADGEIVFRGDIVGDHVIARLRVETATSAFVALACEATSVDLGWRGTRVHLAIARTSTGARVALVHAGVPANGASRELWRGLLADLAVAVRAIGRPTAA